MLSGKPDFQFAAHAHFDPVFLQAAIIDEGNEDVDTQDTYSIALRAGGAFGLFEEADESFIHGAISYATRDLGDQGTVGFETEGGVHALAGDIKVQDDAEFETDDADQIGVEGAFVYGPWSVQGEYYDVSFDGDTNGAGDISDTDVDVSAFYILGSWFITGESRASNYKSNVGKFDKIKPKGTNGAWEVVAKYEDGEVDPDNQNSESEYELLTLGVNWYATNNVKFMLNYLDIDTDNWDSEDGVPLSALGEEDGNAVSFRAQYAF